MLHLNANNSIDGWVKLDGEPNLGKQNIILNIPELNIQQKLTTDKNGLVQLSLKASPELWQPENPKRYKIELSYGKEHSVHHTGFRHIAVDAANTHLNH